MGAPRLVKACLNGQRTRDEHPAVPLTAAELAHDAAACARAGAGAVHVHPRDEAGRETLGATACGAAVRAIREACPGLPVGLSTGAWMEPDVPRRIALVRAWDPAPDFASVNVYEEGAAEVAAALAHAGVEIEAGLSSADDARLLADGALGAAELLRVLIEPVERAGEAAVRAAWAMEAALDAGGIEAPRLHHGEGVATWDVLAEAARRGRDLRVGLEDTLVGPDGQPAESNAALVATAAALS